jgi:murein peptide amidase A
MDRLFFLPLLAFVAGCAAHPHSPEIHRAPVPRAADGLTDGAYMEQFAHIPWREVGRSVENRPIYVAEFGRGEDVTLLFSCFHGGERSTPRFAFEFAHLLHSDPSLIAEGKRVVIVPILNPDGFVRGTRNNARNVDLNRNYPTSNWGEQPEGRRQVDFGPAPASEPETQTVLRLMAEVRPTKILSVHQPLHCNNPDGPAGMPLARLMGEYNRYPIEPDIGFPTPGSYGTYAGKELGIPMVTLELPPGSPHSRAFDQMWNDNREALLAVVNCTLADLPAQ